MTEETNQPTNPQVDPLTIGELISLTDAGDYSGYSVTYLQEVAQSGHLRAKKIGSDWLTTQTAVEIYLKGPLPDPLTIGELVQLSKLVGFSKMSPSYLREIAGSGRLRAKKLGRDWFSTQAAVEIYLMTRKFIYPKENS